MSQHSDLNVLLIETDALRVEAMQELLDQTGANQIGHLATIAAIRNEFDEHRSGVQMGNGLLDRAGVVIVGDIWHPDATTHIGNGVLITLEEEKLAYPLAGVVRARRSHHQAYPSHIPAVSLGYGIVSRNRAYREATRGTYNVNPDGAGALTRLDRALTAAAKILQAV